MILNDFVVDLLPGDSISFSFKPSKEDLEILANSHPNIVWNCHVERVAGDSVSLRAGDITLWDGKVRSDDIKRSWERQNINKSWEQQTPYITVYTPSITPWYKIVIPWAAIGCTLAAILFHIIKTIR